MKHHSETYIYINCDESFDGDFDLLFGSIDDVKCSYYGKMANRYVLAFRTKYTYCQYALERTILVKLSSNPSQNGL